MTKLEIGQKVTTTKRAGVWDVVESDEHMTRLDKPSYGKVLVPTASCTLFEATEENALDARQLSDLATAAVRPLVIFTSQQIAEKMESLAFTENRLYRDLVAELIAHIARSGADAVDIVADALNLIGSERKDTAMYDAAERIKSK